MILKETTKKDGKNFEKVWKELNDDAIKSTWNIPRLNNHLFDNEETEQNDNGWFPDDELKNYYIIPLFYWLYTNDPLHIIKRVRYYLLSPNLFQLVKNEDSISKQLIKEFTNLPRIVFDNSPLTKMHDFLPI